MKATPIPFGDAWVAKLVMDTANGSIPPIEHAEGDNDNMFTVNYVPDGSSQYQYFVLVVIGFQDRMHPKTALFGGMVGTVQLL